MVSLKSRPTMKVSGVAKVDGGLTELAVAASSRPIGGVAVIRTQTRRAIKGRGRAEIVGRTGHAKYESADYRTELEKRAASRFVVRKEGEWTPP